MRQISTEQRIKEQLELQQQSIEMLNYYKETEKERRLWQNGSFRN